MILRKQALGRHMFNLIKTTTLKAYKLRIAVEFKNKILPLSRLWIYLVCYKPGTIVHDFAYHNLRVSQEEFNVHCTYMFLCLYYVL